jgi:hypothetical protein
VKFPKVQDLRKLVTKANRPLFAFLSTRNNAEPINVERILSACREKLDRLDVVELLKELDALNLGNFVAGRRNFPSRFSFYVTPRSIGRVALEEDSHLVRAEIIFPVDQATKKENTRALVSVPAKERTSVQHVRKAS